MSWLDVYVVEVDERQQRRRTYDYYYSPLFYSYYIILFNFILRLLAFDAATFLIKSTGRGNKGILQEEFRKEFNQVYTFN